MAISPLIWFPVGSMIGRRKTYLVATCLLCLCSFGAALAPNVAVFISIWVIGGTTGIVFLVSGQTILSDVFEPVSSPPVVLGACFNTFKDSPRKSGYCMRLEALML